MIYIKYKIFIIVLFNFLNTSLFIYCYIYRVLLLLSVSSITLFYSIFEKDYFFFILTLIIFYYLANCLSFNLKNLI